MKTLSQTAIAIAIVQSASLSSSSAAPLLAYARDGADIGSSATNPANGQAWGNPPHSKPSNPVGTITTTNIAGTGNGGTPQVFTYNVTDSATGLDFDFQVTVTAFSNSTGSYQPANRRAGAVDGPGNAENRNRTEFLTSGNASEFFRTSIDPDGIVVNSPGFNVSFVRWDQVNLSGLDSGVTGEIRPSGETNDPGTGTSLLNFSATGVQTITPDSTTSIDWIPTAGASGAGFQAKGFVAAFDVTQGPELPTEMLSVEFDGTATTITWRSKPEQDYFVYFSSDLLNWVEIDDSAGSPTDVATFIDMIADRFALQELPVPPQGYHRVEENGN